jgi:hypothetical protein
MGTPASFSRLMDVLLADAENVLTYIDDVLVHSRSHEEHLKHLSAAIDKIQGNVCSDRTRWSTWGTRCRGDGVRPGQDKAKAMQTAQLPRSVKELRLFCGLANYFRSYIVQFALVQTDTAGFRLERGGTATRSVEGISPAKRGDIEPASHGISKRHWTVPPICRCRPGRREQFGGVWERS